MLASMANNINVRTLPAADSLDTSFTVLDTVTKYIPVGGTGSRIHSTQIVWHDTTTAGDLTLESTNQVDADIDSADDKLWSLEPTVIPSIPGGADGSYMLHIGNSGAVKYRIKFVATADSEISNWICGK